MKEEYPMKEWLTMKTTFNDESSFEGNEIDHALVVSFTSENHGGIKFTEITKREMVIDWKKYDDQKFLK